MCCQVESSPKTMRHPAGCTCGCCGCGCGPWPRRFITPAEEKERLERYTDTLKHELADVEEALKGLNASPK
jgi:hypothetical protein